ncbi:MAG: hypothetical protein C7B46_07800 [Sulfobacillus benefaciens]|uniref:Uncharacterized protein n=1 Tax=Sulfobacillus benefaciens TaxID=453960 RepID=A0A2T2XHD4_9FIRM|nr:MAG: hypothetical protein C7B46_07800 [Sulfobacillus benefaciens]
MPKTPNPSSVDLQILLKEALKTSKTVTTQVAWRKQILALTNEQQEKLLELWKGATGDSKVPNDGLNWAIPLLDQVGSRPVHQHLLTLLDAMPERLRLEFWMTALGICDCWTTFAAIHGKSFETLVVPLLRKAAQQPGLPDEWWTHWMAGVRALISNYAGNVSSWVPQVQDVLKAGQPSAIAKDPTFMVDLKKAVAESVEMVLPTPKSTKKAGHKKGKPSTNSSQSTPSQNVESSAITDIWRRMRNLIDLAETDVLKVLAQQEALQTELRKLSETNKELTEDIAKIRKNLEGELHKHKEIQASYEELAMANRKTEAEVTRLREELTTERRLKQKIQDSYREISELEERTKMELAEWRRAAEMWEHQAQSQRESGELEFRDQLRRGPVRMASHVKGYVESVLEGDPNPELIPLLGLSFDELHRSLLGLAEMPQEARIRRELLRKEGES